MPTTEDNGRVGEKGGGDAGGRRERKGKEIQERWVIWEMKGVK